MESRGSKAMPDIEEMLENLAIQKAWAEGRDEGRNEGRGELLLQLIEQKFGALPDELRKRLTAASVDEIGRWSGRLLEASSFEELFGDSNS